MTADAERTASAELRQAAETLHLIQYRLEEQHSSVLCAAHRRDVLAGLRSMNIGCVGMPAPEGATCDGCRTEAMS